MKLSSQNQQLCSPNHEKTPGCFDKQGLQTLASIINEKVPSDKQINLNESEETLRSQVFHYFQTHSQCHNSLCMKEWANQQSEPTISIDMNQPLSEYLKPTRPHKWESNNNTWLNTLDINSVLKQYEEKYPDFCYVGAVPNDFDTIRSSGECVDQTLCSINIDTLYKKGIRKIGIVFNTDPSTKGGSHWISLFMSLTNGSICYIDSAGNPPSPEVIQLIVRLQNQANQLLLSRIIRYKDIDKTYSNYGKLKKSVQKGDTVLHVTANSKNQLFTNQGVIFLKQTPKLSRPYYVLDVHHEPNTRDFQLTLSKPLARSYSAQTTQVVQRSFMSFINTKRHQTSNTECGVYSIYFLVKQIEGQLFHDLISQVIPDSTIETFRNIFFNPRKYLSNKKSVMKLDMV